MIITTDKQMRPRDPDDFYPTPAGLCDAALAILPPGFCPDRILDPGAGAGPWGAAARDRWGPAPYIVGSKLRTTTPPASYDYWAIGDFLTDPAFAPDPVSFPPMVDLVIGNPPYKHAEAFVRRSLALTRPGGYVAFLLRLAFLEGQARGAGLWREFPPAHVAVCSRRPSFTGNGKTDATAYAVIVWRVGTAVTSTLSFLSFDDATTGAAQALRAAA